MDVFGKQFQAPPEIVYEYIRLNTDVSQQRLLVFLDRVLTDEYNYRSRRHDLLYSLLFDEKRIN
jgi:hypothetical protein